KLPTRVTEVDDVAPFLFKWDTAAIVESYDYFRRKWGMDIGDGGKWPGFLVQFNAKLGLLPRWFPSRTGFFLDEWVRRGRSAAGAPVRAFRRLKAQMLGAGAWAK
ncbi:MAG TPA: hypothetical protein VIZ69_03195, partial [Thermoanaerobaculia bacterium]